ncbi:MAG TPA: hypothetical protein VFQ76_20260, partial [Longimicrobiaceae bacterium]|nr:hypothetical protein [Longimicrobiaceae bacterium]
MKIALVLAAGLALAAPCGLAAQQKAPPLAPGARVRIVAPALSQEKISGTVVSVDSDWVHLASTEPAAERWLHLSLVDSADVSLGLNRGRRAFKGSTWGAFLGFGAGVISGALLAQHLPTGVATSAALGAVGVGLVGGGIGAGIGALTPRERWQAYNYTYAAAPSAGPAVGTP